MSPAQTFLAHNSVARLQHTLRTLHALGVHRPSEITLPIEELECLAIAASPVLGIDPRQFDLGGWHDEAGAAVTNHESRGEIEPRAEWHIPT
jgi:hypothetical protein